MTIRNSQVPSEKAPHIYKTFGQYCQVFFKEEHLFWPLIRSNKPETTPHKAASGRIFCAA
jgi:hypothetical protein